MKIRFTKKCQPPSLFLGLTLKKPKRAMNGARTKNILEHKCAIEAE